MQSRRSRMLRMLSIIPLLHRPSSVSCWMDEPTRPLGHYVFVCLALCGVVMVGQLWLPDLRGRSLVVAVTLCTLLLLGVVYVLLGRRLRKAFRFRRNKGHRAAYVSGRAIPENSLLSVERALTSTSPRRLPLQMDPEFLYLEFDVRETLDGQLVVFHDATLGRMIDPVASADALRVLEESDPIRKRAGPRRRATTWRKWKIRHMSLTELQSLRLVGGGVPQTIPTVKQFLDHAARCHLMKPVVADIKEIRTDEARYELLRLLKEFRESYMEAVHIVHESNFDFPTHFAVGAIAWPWNYYHCFGIPFTAEWRLWSREFRRAGLSGVYMPYFHSINMAGNAP